MRSVLPMWDSRNGCQGDRVQDGAGIAGETAQVSASEAPEVGVGRANSACTARQGIAVVKLEARHYVATRSHVTY